MAEKMIYRQDPCPNAANHADEPPGYLAWHAWAKRMGGRGNRQSKCPGCGLYKIWHGKDFPARDTLGASS